MNQTDKGPEENEEVCSTTEVQYAEKNGGTLERWNVRMVERWCTVAYVSPELCVAVFRSLSLGRKPSVT